MSQVVERLDVNAPEAKELVSRWTRTLALIEREIQEREIRAGSGGAGTGPGGGAGTGPGPTGPSQPAPPKAGRAAA